MQSLLDIIGATIIGGMLLVTMFTSLITIQENNMMLKGEMQIINDLEYISNMIDNYYMEKIGYELPGGVEAFPLAESDEINFNTKIDDGDNTIYLVKIFTGNEDADYGYPLWIQVSGGTNIGPVWLSEPMEFRYYNVNGTELSTGALLTAAGRATIRSVEIVISVFHGEYNTDSMRARTLVFKKYFPNLAI
jgi:hypothetical protein